MPTLGENFEVTDTPQDIVAGLALANGTDYRLFCIGPGSVYFIAAAVQPEARYHKGVNYIDPKEDFAFMPTAGDPIWVWTTPGRKSGIAVD